MVVLAISHCNKWARCSYRSAQHWEISSRGTYSIASSLDPATPAEDAQIPPWHPEAPDASMLDEPCDDDKDDDGKAEPCDEPKKPTPAEPTASHPNHGSTSKSPAAPVANAEPPKRENEKDALYWKFPN